MALFKTKKDLSAKAEKVGSIEKTKKISVKKEETKVSVGKPKEMRDTISRGNLFSVLKYARVTEKATDLSQNHNVYVFEVDKNTNKQEIKKAIKNFYSVTPKKIRIIKIPSKNVISRGKRGVKSGGKKVYVYLKKDDKLEII
ncbi:MAG: 50S ribosomal protein L23 [Candidatus Paceibacterota bacterium]